MSERAADSQPSCAVSPPRLRLRKLPYYLRLLARLAAAAERPHQVAARLLRPAGELALRLGATVRLESRLDLLVLAEIVCDDVYRLRALDPDATLIVDVGAGIGEFAVPAAMRYPRARVVAIEPDPGRFELLRRNVSRNALSNVELHRAAAGRPESSDVPLGRFLGSGYVDLLKIDCEGAEVDVLLGLAPDELARVGRVALEWHRGPGAPRDEQAAAILRSHGFRVDLLADRYESARGYAHAEREPDAGASTADGG